MLKYIFLTHLIILLLTAAWFFFYTSDEIIIKPLAAPYKIITSLLFYTAVFLPVSASSAFYVFVLTDKKQYRDEGVNYFLLRASRIIIPLFTVYSIMHLYLNPLLLEKKEWIADLSETARSYLEEIESSTNPDSKSDLEKACVFTNLYLYIDPDNEDIKKLHTDLHISLLEKMRKNGGKEINTGDDKFSPYLLTGKKLIEISEIFLEKNDYSSAIYYSEIAGNFKKYKKSSEQIVKKAASELKGYVSSDPDKTMLFNRKLEISGLYEKGNYTEAWYKTVNLKKIFPGDSELVNQSALIEEKLIDNSFFYEEIENFIFVPGKKDIIFRETHNNETMIIKIGKMVFGDGNVYLFNINGFYPESGNFWSAPYGKIIGNNINMYCLGKFENKSFLPEYNEGFKNKNTPFTSIPLSYTGDQLIGFSTGNINSLEKIGTLTLFSDFNTLQNGKFGKTALLIEAGNRIIRCINVLIILFLAIYTGLSFMKRGKNKNYLTLLLYPLVLLISAAADSLLFSFNAGIYENLLLTSGEWKTFLLFSVFIIFELCIVLYLAVKRGTSGL